MFIAKLQKHKVLLFIIFTSFLSFLFFNLNINSYKFSFVGDDWSFFFYAKSIINKNFLINPFSLGGVYNQNGNLGSIYQAYFLYIFGKTHLAWRLSNTILIIPISILFFLWVRNAFNQHLALFSTLFLQTSFFLANFFKIGYPQPFFLLFFMLSLYIAQKTFFSPTTKHVLILAVTLGISFYLRVGVVYPLFLLPYLLPLVRNSLNRKQIIYSALLYCACVVLGIISSTSYILTHNMEALFFPKDVFDFILHAFNGILINFVSFYFPVPTSYVHYINAPFFDPITSICAIIGFILLVKNKDKEQKRVLFIFLTTILFLSISSPYLIASPTRAIFYIHFGALFAGIGLTFFISFFKKYRGVFLIYFFGFIFLLNMYISQIRVFEINGYGTVQHIIEYIQQLSDDPSKSDLFLVASPTIPQFHVINIIPWREIKASYGISNPTVVIINSSQVSRNTLCKKNIFTVYFYGDKKAQNRLTNLKCLKKNQYAEIIDSYTYK